MMLMSPLPSLNTERYRVLPCPASQLKFLVLQRELVDDFRIRLTQVTGAPTRYPPGHSRTSLSPTVLSIGASIQQ